MMEIRRHKRVAIPLPVKLKAMNANGNKILDLVTRDISYTGTFIPTLTSFPDGTRFNMDFTLPNDNLEELKDIKSLKNCTGEIVRSEPHGIAIKVDDECQIESLKSL